MSNFFGRGLQGGNTLTWVGLRRVAHRVAAVLMACVLMTTLALAAAPTLAFAEDDENLVNPQQRPDSSFIYDTSIAALSNADSYFDNQTVQIVGEAVGDSIRGGLDNRHRWITLAASEKNSTATVAVYMSAESASKIDTFGKYGMTGTMLQVRGTFQLVCPEHEGLTDLHADVVSVVEKGKHHQDELDLNAFLPGAAAVGVGLILLGVFYYLRERQR